MDDGNRFDELWDLLSRAAEGCEVTPDILCRVVVEHLGVTAAAVTVPDDLLGSQTIGAFGAAARRLEELQVTIGEGPSLDGLRGVFPVLVEDITLPQYRTRWPMFVADAGIASLCVTPMRAGGARFGVLTVYLEQTGGLDRERAADARIFARIAMELLLGHARGAGGHGEDDPSKDRLFFDDRPEIHQATGMVSAQLGVDLATAVLRMRARAFAEGRLLSELALDVVLRKVRFDERETA